MKSRAIKFMKSLRRFKSFFKASLNLQGIYYVKVMITVKCPECGEDFVYDRREQRYICRSCGLTMTREEYTSNTKRGATKKDEKDSLRREYLKWWLSKKS